MPTNGITFDIGKATGRIGTVSFKWETYGNGVLVHEARTDPTSVPKPGADAITIDIDLDPGVTADTNFILPVIEDDKGAVAITKVEILESGALALLASG